MLIDLTVSLSFGYILGSIPFGFVMVYLVTNQDIRTIGSGNIGATNVLRSGHKELALLTLILDALKGAGGKGVATGMAVIAVVVPFTGLIMAAIWLLVAAFTRISSLSSLVSFAAAGLFVSFGPFENSGMAQITVWGVGLLSWGRHKPNIQRILSGEESKISFRKKPSD